MREINITGDIGYWPNTLARVQDELNESSGDVQLSINTYGGNAYEGLAIYAKAKSINASGNKKVNTAIVGYAMSSGSIISCAGDTVSMTANAFLLIHNPWSIEGGEADDMEKAAERLRAMKENILNVYMAKIGSSSAKNKPTRNAVSKMMDKETLLTAKEAKDFGFIDKITDSIEVTQNSFKPESLNGLKPETRQAINNHFKPSNMANQKDNNMTFKDIFNNWFGNSNDNKDGLTDEQKTAIDTISNKVENAASVDFVKEAVNTFTNHLNEQFNTFKNETTELIASKDQAIADLTDVVNSLKAGGTGGEGGDGKNDGHGAGANKDANNGSNNDIWDLIMKGK